ncbi:zinc-binding dehydrogenase [Sphingopyxis sp.]|uniref:zinc-binding dehydrogenase n=1 Tax=Sphingopyxis sp. TaxID=1908224 RepID=UPI0025EC4436|nr:zinc-binding dehydrogenase [Sphingopyxis sp.]
MYAAAGSVGQLLAGWANHVGATVIGAVGSHEKIAAARRAGCHDVINYRTDDIAARVREMTGGAGVSVVYDSIGKNSFDASLDSLAVRGTMVSFGNASGPIPPFDIARLTQKGSITLVRPSSQHFIGGPGERDEIARSLFGLIERDVLHISIHRRYGLEGACDAHP